MEVVYENATKVDKRVTYTISSSNKPRTITVKAGNRFKMPVGAGFEIVKTESIE